MYIKTKTISCHYDQVYCLEHNNRDFISPNVDPARTVNNYNCVVAGGEVIWEWGIPYYIPDIWKGYHKLAKLYWEERALAKALMMEEYWEQRRMIQRYREARQKEEVGLIGATLELIFLPLIIIDRVKTNLAYYDELKRIEDERRTQEIEMYLSDMMMQAYGNSIRMGLLEYDRERGTHCLERMDRIVSAMAEYAQDVEHMELRYKQDEGTVPHFASIEEIYSKLYEPPFREFQARQRPCRRYKGTYLEQIREGQVRERQKKQQNKNIRCRAPAEAIEIVIGIGDMDKTGYLLAPDDAYKSETLLKEYCDYLMTKQSNICVVTTRELEDPDWQPPFKNGLIVLNMTVHTDEATPGIHLTCIPYSRDCQRGPAVHASLGRAMAGMGYPSTWKDALDENGERIPKRNKNGDIILNKDGSVRYQQEPDKQGIIDWIEDQKRWIQEEMMRRYDWSREYKGSHPRGNLSTPDYKIARAKERQAEIEKQVQDVLSNATARIEKLLRLLNSSADYICKNDNSTSLLAHYINSCSDEEYERILQQAEEYMKSISRNEKIKVHQALNEIIQNAGMKQKEQSKPQTDKETHCVVR